MEEVLQTSHIYKRHKKIEKKRIENTSFEKIIDDRYQVELIYKMHDNYFLTNVCVCFIVYESHHGV